MPALGEILETSPMQGAADQIASRATEFVVRLVSIDYYMARPTPGLDECYSQLEGRAIDQVPILRIFGATPGGQKTCLHVHGVSNTNPAHVLSTCHIRHLCSTSPEKAFRPNCELYLYHLAQKGFSSTGLLEIARHTLHIINSFEVLLSTTPSLICGRLCPLLDYRGRLFFTLMCQYMLATSTSCQKCIERCLPWHQPGE